MRSPGFIARIGANEAALPAWRNCCVFGLSEKIGMNKPGLCVERFRQPNLARFRRAVEEVKTLGSAFDGGGQAASYLAVPLITIADASTVL